MSVMNTELYDALRNAGADDEKARDAAASVAAYDSRLNRIDRDLSLLKWMLGFNLVFTGGVLWRLIDIGAKITG